MKTVAFAGQHQVLKQIIMKYTNTEFLLDQRHHQMRNEDTVKILASKYPNSPDSNKYGWTIKADRIFICVSADDPDFLENLKDELKVWHYDRDKVVLVGHADILNEDILKHFQEFANALDFPLIYCSVITDNAFYSSEEIVSYQDFNQIFENVINHTEMDAVQEQAADVSATLEPKPHRCMVM